MVSVAHWISALFWTFLLGAKVNFKTFIVQVTDLGIRDVVVAG